MTVLTTSHRETAVAGQIVELERGAWSMEVAHTRDREDYEKIGRRLSVGVVILTAAVGSGVLVSVAASPNTLVKVIVGIASLCAAVLAAVNEKGPYADLRKEHQAKAEQFGKVHGDLEELRRHFSLGKVDVNTAIARLDQLAAAYEDAKMNAPGRRDYRGALEWVNTQLEIKARTEAEGR